MEDDSRSKLLQSAALIGAVRIVLAPLVLFGVAYAYKTMVLFLGFPSHLSYLVLGGVRSHGVVAPEVPQIIDFERIFHQRTMG